MGCKTEAIEKKIRIKQRKKKKKEKIKENRKRNQGSRKKNNGEIKIIEGWSIAILEYFFTCNLSNVFLILFYHALFYL